MAGINPRNGECIRPLPYLDIDRCKELNIMPGTILRGAFKKPPHIESPHIEDRFHDDLKYIGACTSEEFKDILSQSMCPSVDEGFSIELNSGQKHIPLRCIPEKSIITLSVNPDSISLCKSSYEEKTVKLDFSDGVGKKFKNISITDLGFHEYMARAEKTVTDIRRINDFLRNQEEVFLRLGLTRPYRAPDGREGFWIQINGIYTFPEYIKEIRSYT